VEVSPAGQRLFDEGAVRVALPKDWALMQVTETVNEGLKRSLKVVVDASELERDFSSRLGQLSGQVRLKGFRPGKVPVNHLRRIYGKSVMAEVVQKKVDDSSKMALAERQLKPAYSPQIDLPQDQGEIEKMMEGKGDLAFTMTFEIVPAIEVKDFSTLEVEKLTVEVTDQQIDDALTRIAAQNIEFETKPDEAQKGDRVTLSFVGRIDGEAFEGGSAEDVPLVLGSGQFLPGFEDQLIGAKAGEARLVKTEFPTDYSVAKLAGKPAEFEVTVKAVAAPKQAEIDDALAQKLGLENLGTLKANVKARLGAEFAQMSAMKLKRDVLDQLDAQYNFELPQRLVDGEFNQIWTALQREMQQSGRSFADENTTEEEAQKEYQAIANRRVRLGLLLGTVGEQAGVTISDEEMQRALMDRARQFPGQERRVIDYYRKNSNALIELRGPVFEQKVIDYILAQAKVTEKKVTREELAKAVEDDQEFHPVSLPHNDGDHDHEHGHDHAHDHGDHDHDHPHDHDH
jgi:trigger factor